MSECAMGASLRETEQHLAQGLRGALVAGPGAVVEVDAPVLAGALRVAADARVVAAGLAAAGHVDRRRRVLTGMATVATILGLCLYRRENYDLVIARALAAVPRVAVEGHPCAPALSKARGRLAGGVMRRVFERSAAAMPEPGPDGEAFGLVVTAFDGTVLDLAASAEMREAFATPTGGRFPQARVVTLIACGTRWILGARLGSAALSEQALVDQMVEHLGPGMLNLADRNFFAMHRWVRFAATGAHLAWRVKNGVRSLPGTLVTVLPDGSALLRLRESDAMLTTRRGKAGDPRLARLPETIVRLVEFTLTVTDRSGRARTSRFRILTTLLDHEAYPAEQIAALYGERWQVELIYARIKTQLRGADTRLRGQSPALATQEIWGLLIVYNALVSLAVTAAVRLGVDPDEICFAAVLALTRTSLASDTCCAHCGHRPSSVVDPADSLVTAITTQTRNRIERQRTSPRTAEQRQTEHTRDVTYLITIVPSTLVRNDETALS